MSTTFLAACDLRAVDAHFLLPPPLARQASIVFQELSQIIVTHLPLADLALVALCVDRNMSGAARVQLAILQPKLAPLLAAPFMLRPSDLLHAKELDIWGNTIGDTGMISLSEAISNGALGALQKLFLYENQIGDAGMVEFSRAIASGSLRALEYLDLANNQIGNVGMIEFSRSIPIGSMGVLKVLLLNHNQIGDAGLRALAGAIGNGSLRSLTMLRLNHNNISDLGMIAFAEALKSPMGSLPACATILVEDGNPGNAAPLEAACEERGIVCM